MIWTLLIIAVIIILLGLVLAAIPTLVSEFLLGMLGGEREAYALLVELPLISDVIPAGATRAQQIGPAMSEVYDLMQTISLSLFGIILIVAGLCYVLESFRIVSEGTAAHIITSSIFTFILIFAAKPIYNLTASAINALTSPEAGLILNWKYIIDLISAAVGFSGGNIAEVITKFITSIIFLIFTAVTLLIIAVLGTLRLFFVGACAAVLPLLLVLRLIPLTTRLTDSVIDSLIGFMFSSIMAAIFILFGYQVITVAGWGTLYKTIAALATLLAAAFMPTVFAKAVGSLMMSVAGLATAATSTAVGATTLVAGGAVIGGLTAGIKTGVAGMGKAEAFGAGARGVLAGAVQGLKTGITHPISITPSARGVLRGTSAAIRGAKETGLGAFVAGFDVSGNLVEKRLGSTIEANIGALALGSPPPGATPEIAEEWLEKDFKTSPLEKTVSLLERAAPDVMGSLDEKRKRGIAQMFKDKIIEIAEKASPLVAYTAVSGFEAIGGMPEKKMKNEALGRGAKTAMKEKDKINRLYHGDFFRTPFEKYDKDITYALGSLDTMGTSKRTRMAGIKLLYAMKQADEQALRKKILAENRERARKELKSLRRLNPSKKGAIIGNWVGMPLSSRGRREVGSKVGQLIDLEIDRKPELLETPYVYHTGGHPKWTRWMRSPKFGEKAEESWNKGEIQAYYRSKLELKKPEKTLGFNKLFELPLPLKPSKKPKKKPKRGVKKPPKPAKIKKPKRGAKKPPKPVSKPRKKVVIKGFGPDALRELEDYLEDKNNRKKK